MSYVTKQQEPRTHLCVIEYMCEVNKVRQVYFYRSHRNEYVVSHGMTYLQERERYKQLGDVMGLERKVVEQTYDFRDVDSDG